MGHPPQRTRPNGTAHTGRFTVTTDAIRIYCGICGEGFDAPHAKAQHLRVSHYARIERHVSDAGVEEYHWSLPLQRAGDLTSVRQLLRRHHLKLHLSNMDRRTRQRIDNYVRQLLTGEQAR